MSSKNRICFNVSNLGDIWAACELLKEDLYLYNFCISGQNYQFISKTKAREIYEKVIKRVIDSAKFSMAFANSRIVNLKQNNNQYMFRVRKALNCFALVNFTIHKSELNNVNINLEISASTEEFGIEFTTFLDEVIREVIDKIKIEVENDKCNIDIWFLGAGGNPKAIRKKIIFQEWEEIKPNYPSIRDQIEYLINHDSPYEDGKLIFFYGVPGTGKTHAIMSLMGAWEKNMKCKIDIITDSEKFFESLDYMNEVIYSKERYIDTDYPMKDSNVLEEDKEEQDPTQILRLVVLEDAPDLVLLESRAQKSHIMSRLLNITDGIISQGSRIIYLVTTNEDIESIDPAFVRHGRALQILQFPLFTSGQANKWLENNRIDKKVTEEVSLAKLYNMKNKKG